MTFATDEKADILPLATNESKPRSLWKSRVFGLIAGALIATTYFSTKTVNLNIQQETLCPLVEKVDPTDFIYNKDTLFKLINDRESKLERAAKLSKAIQVPTEVYDNMVNPNSTESYEELYEKEPLWKNMELFHKYLEDNFPLVHEHLNKDKVNKFGLIFTWEGKNSTKKPLMLTAHQDVVPVQKETLDSWAFPPFDGAIKDGIIYGRGASDCKNLLVGLMETIELLLSEGTFIPERTIILAFGFDEESGGPYGAGPIGEFLLDKYGPDSMYQIIDEGNTGFSDIGGVGFITPATAEKGRVDSVIELFTPGGHSSIPPPHTSIGILSEFISLVEKTPFDSIITEKNPVLHQLQCVAENADIDAEYKATILLAHKDKKANSKLLNILNSKDVTTKYLVTTSQAADMILGGAKANALPEHAQVLIDHRIAVEQDINFTVDKVLKNLKVIAKRFNLGLIYEGKEIFAETENGYFSYTLQSPLEPAPVTPTDTKVWNTFGGALRYLYEDLLYPSDNKKFVFAPYLSTGNTDTRYYWNLTANIFRYVPSVPTPPGHIHSVNELTTVDSHSVIAAFYYYYIQLVDQYD